MMTTEMIVTQELVQFKDRTRESDRYSRGRTRIGQRERLEERNGERES